MITTTEIKCYRCSEAAKREQGHWRAIPPEPNADILVVAHRESAPMIRERKWVRFPSLVYGIR